MLKIDSLTIRFGGLAAVENLSTGIRKGEIFGLIGPNGAGKTTTFNMISGVYAPTSGTITFNGRQIQGLRPDQIARLGITRTYQNINLFGDMTVLENVLTGCHTLQKANLWTVILGTPSVRREEARVHEKSEALLEYVGLARKRNEKARNLPYGEQRKLEIARAMASDPQLLLLDEPAAGMNLAEKDDLAALIRRINADGKTILLVEHNMKLVMSICDRICVLNFGKKLAEGTPEEIQGNPAVVSAYLGGKK